MKELINWHILFIMHQLRGKECYKYLYNCKLIKFRFVNWKEIEPVVPEVGRDPRSVDNLM